MSKLQISFISLATSSLAFMMMSSVAFASELQPIGAYLDEQGEVVIVGEHQVEEIATTKPNPSDLTQVNTFAYGQYEGEDARIMTGLSGQFSEGNVFMGLIEHSVNTKDSSQNSRLRYFQVLDTGLSSMPQAGASVDYMKGWDAKSDIVALGGIAKLTTPWDALTLYPNLAYVTGKAAGKTISGYQTNLFASLAVGSSGEYMVFQPQFMDTNMGEQFKVKTGFGAPLNQAGSLWWDIGHQYEKTKANGHKAIDDHKFSVGLSYYF